MSTTTESPFSLTIKVGPNNDLLTGRADTVEQMVQRIAELKSLAASMQGVTQQQAASVQGAVAALAAAGIEATVVETVASPSAGAIEERTDKFGNRYQSGNPDAGACAHGGRIVKHGTSKAGRAYKAYVCLNDSPFGDYKQTKCETAWPAR